MDMEEEDHTNFDLEELSNTDSTTILEVLSIRPVPYCPNQPLLVQKSKEGRRLKGLLTRNGKEVKKEYVRVHFVRDLKNRIRTILSKKPIRFEDETIGEMRRTIEGNDEYFEQISVAKPSVNGHVYPSHSDEYLKAFFSEPIMRDMWHFYILCLFTEPHTPADLCKRLKHKCCTSQSHKQACSKQWEQLKVYLERWVLEEVGYAEAESTTASEELMLFRESDSELFIETVTP